MTEILTYSGATSNFNRYWDSINWDRVKSEVKKLQMRIAKAVKKGKWNKVKVLQRLLTRSFYAKLLAIKRVTSSRGSRTPGVDGVKWNTPKKKLSGLLSLKQRSYQAKPLRRVSIKKKNGKKRPLGIPTMKDRAMQALYLLALEPVSETTADPNSYGFRPYRGCRDAISQCFCALAKGYSAKWILDADIKACFDKINHKWLMENIPIEKNILKQWLSCGYMENRQLFPTKFGTPQGGIISPLLANMALDGLEDVVRKYNKRGMKINFIRYADDFVVTAAHKETLEKLVIPEIKKFLIPRGLELSEEKTKIVHINEGFNFLGQNMRKYNNKLITQPEKESIKRFKEKVKKIIKQHWGTETQIMIKRLNAVIRGWSYYHRYVQSGRVFYWLQFLINKMLISWAKKRHRKRSLRWIWNHYWNISKTKRKFSCKVKNENGKTTIFSLIYPPDIRLARYIKIKGKANPFDLYYQIVLSW